MKLLSSIRGSRVALGILAVLSYILCMGCATPAKPVPLEVVVPGEQLAGEGTPLYKPSVVLAKSLKDFGRLRDMNPVRTKKFGLAETDFDNRFLVLITAGRKGTTGYRLEIERMEFLPRTKELRIFVKNLSPSDTNLGGDPAISVPCVVASIPREFLPRLIVCMENVEVFPVAVYLHGFPDKWGNFP